MTFFLKCGSSCACSVQHADIEKRGPYKLAECSWSEILYHAQQGKETDVVRWTVKVLEKSF